MTLDEAERALAAAKAKAVELELAVSIAVVDGRGDLWAFARLDGARHFTPDLAVGKAILAGAMGQPSAALVDAAGSVAFSTINDVHRGRMVFAPGGVPALVDGAPVGAVGVSGATGEQDQEIATAGVGVL
jgi:uncharacterized protein GlcG (DUF336 family)